MLGHEARETAIGKRNAVGSRGLELCRTRRVRRETRPCATRSADAAHGSRVRRVTAASAGIVVMAVAVIVHVLLGRGSATMLRLAQRHQYPGVAAHRQRREQQGEQNDPAGMFHGENLSMAGAVSSLLRWEGQAGRPRSSRIGQSGRLSP